MRTELAKPIRLADYRPPDYLIDTVDLDVKLDPHATRVLARLSIRPNPKGRSGADLTLDGDGLAAKRILLDGRDVSEAIRSPEVSEAASRVAADAGVRAALVSFQRALIADGDWVAEGRDIGTVVAPEAELKVFLTASPEERARRRAAELGADPQTVLAEQALRDERDTTREHSPLAAAPGAVLLDTSGLTVAEVVERIATLAATASTAE